jgi:signal transduction histidine kinase/ligand-binding sensor domain-containing protein
MVLLWISVWTSCLHGQQPEQPMLLRHQALSTWTTEQGLPQEFITAITQTPDGFLWIGTYGGLTRFDGLHFHTFVHDAPAALHGNISSLAVDKNGALWIGTSTGLFLYRNHLFQPIRKPGNPQSPLAVSQILPRRAGGAWVQSKSEILWANVNGAHTESLPIPSNELIDLCEDNEGRLWLALHDRIVFLQGGKIAGSYPLPKVQLLYCAPDGRLFAGDGHHLFLFTHEHFVNQPHSGTEEFIQVLIDRHNNLWMASGGLQGISRLAAGTMEMLGKDTGLTSNDVRVLFEDRDGDLWIGTIAGLQRLHTGVFTSFTARDGLAPGNNQYDAIFEDARDAIWAGTLEEGIAQWQNGQWKTYGVREGVRRGQVRGFAEAGDKPVFAMADYGIFGWSGSDTSGRFQALPDIPAGYVTAPLRTKDGSLWFGVRREGVVRILHGKRTVYGTAQGLTDDTVWSLAADARGDLWAGTDSGLFHWHDEHWTKDPHPVRMVYGILPRPDGSLFLGTGAGLVFYGTGKGATSWNLSQRDGLPGDAIFGLVEDAHGDLWLTAAGGICRIPRTQLDQLNSGASKQVNPEIYTLADGLKGRGVLPMGQVTATRARDGHLWFATTAAPAMTSPVLKEEAPPQALLDDVTIDEKHVAPDKLTVPPGRHRLTFNFTAPSFIAPEQIRFRYRLTGWDSNWIAADTTREASYVGLPPGQYSFQVQALGRTGEAGPISEATALTLEPFFWQTRWFLFAMIALTAGLVIEITRRRTQARVERLNMRFQERATERERIASQIHDTFIQDLIGTALQLELVGLQMEEDTAVAHRSLHDLAARLRGVIARSRDIISNLHSMAAPEQGLVELLQHVDAEFRMADEPAFEVAGEGVAIELSPFIRDEVYRICREALANVFRHAAAKHVLVTVHFGSDLLRIIVADDGVGMTEQIQTNGRPGHFGLSGMRAHARRIGARLIVQSECDHGTQVTLELELRQKTATRLNQAVRHLRQKLHAYTVIGRQSKAETEVELPTRRDG